MANSSEVAWWLAWRLVSYSTGGYGPVGRSAVAGCTAVDPLGDDDLDVVDASREPHGVVALLDPGLLTWRDRS